MRFAIVVAIAWVPPVPAAAQLEPGLAATTFDSAWERIRDTHHDPAMNGVDWNAVRDELRPRAAMAASPAELRSVLGEMLGRLDASHFAVLPGTPTIRPGSPRPAGAGSGSDPGLVLRHLDGALVVARLRPGGPAALAGIGTGWIVEAIDSVEVDSLAIWVTEGTPPGAEERQRDLRLPLQAGAYLDGPEGVPVHLRLRDGTETTREMSVSRWPSPGEVVDFGDLPVPRVEVEHRIDHTPSGRSVGVLRLSAWFPPALAGVAEAMEEFRTVEGVVLDLRGNPGGLAALAMGVGGHFLTEPASLGTMTTRDAVLHFPVNPQRVTADGRRVEPYGGPLAIVVDALTASTSEVFAAGLQGLGRARVFGEATAGQALPALVSTLPNGDRLLHAVADFTSPDGSRLEGGGVIPDVPTPLTRETLLAGRDPALEAAMAWLDYAAETSAPPLPRREPEP